MRSISTPCQPELTPCLTRTVVCLQRLWQLSTTTSVVPPGQQRRRVYPYRCQQCNFGTTNIVRWKEHRTRHTGIKSFVCTVCGLPFRLKNHHDRHVVQAHGTQTTSWNDSIPLPQLADGQHDSIPLPQLADEQQVDTADSLRHQAAPQTGQAPLQSGQAPLLNPDYIMTSKLSPSSDIQELSDTQDSNT